jgi:hypothetical protein
MYHFFKEGSMKKRVAFWVILAGIVAGVSFFAMRPVWICMDGQVCGPIGYCCPGGAGCTECWDL